MLFRPGRNRIECFRGFKRKSVLSFLPLTLIYSLNYLPPPPSCYSLGITSRGRLTQVPQKVRDEEV